jgi:hypothetical protein
MPEEENQQPNFNYVRDKDFRSVYANNTIFASTAFDFAMTFAEIMEVDPAKAQITAEKRVKVVMSPLHFKLFAHGCLQNVEQYEKVFGTIQLQDGRTGGVAFGVSSPTPTPTSAPSETPQPELPQSR